MYGTQTNAVFCSSDDAFENDVKMYGTQTYRYVKGLRWWFENDVKMYGTQTEKADSAQNASLRMM